MTDQTDLILLSRAEVERHRDELRGDEYAAANDATRAGQEAAEACRDAADRLVALLAAARPVVDAGVWGVLEDTQYLDDRELASSDKSGALPVGERHIYYIAADAAEEGE